MIRHVVVLGEWLAKIAGNYGTTVAAIWGAPENAEHRAKRGSPSILHPGDILWIPVHPSGEEPPPEPPPPPPKADYRPYVVQQGDYLSRLAFLLRFDAKAVWGELLNAGLRALRDPDVLFPGDLLWVPPPPVSGLELVANVVNSYIAERPLTQVKVRFVDGGSPWSHTPVAIYGLPAEPPPPTQTDGDGQIVLQVPVTVPTVDVELTTDNGPCLYTLLIGHLDPVTELTGLWARLSALGHLGSPADIHGVEDTSVWDDAFALAAALRAFQRVHNLPVNGVATPETLARLVSEYGS